jgi:hypothetical protein
MLLPNAVYRLLPAELRRARIVRAPINREDPTEAVESSRILPAIARRFEILERRDYGGNLLSIIYPNLRRPPAGTAERAKLDDAVALMLDIEDSILRHRALVGAETFFTALVARPR